MCESPVDVRFEPCGHAVMCSSCAPSPPKRCPRCKVILNNIGSQLLQSYVFMIYNILQSAINGTSKVKLVLMCPMCNEEEATVTMKPCGHVFCPG